MISPPLPGYRKVALTAAFAAAALGLSSCSGSSGGDSDQINVVGFSVIKTAYGELSDAFTATEAGKGFSFKGSFGASGAQARAVVAGQRADVVAFSLTPDMEKVVKAGVVDPGWNADPRKGIVSRSVVVITVRKGNPLGIRGWDDLVKPGTKIITPDPGTSGAAKWNLMAAYAQAMGPSKDEAAGKAYLEKFVKNVVSWNDSARTATDAFVQGTGDVMISYENEAIAARAAGVELDYVVPASTFLIENPAAVTKTAPPAASQFLSFITSPEGQQVLGSKGFRPADDSLKVTGVKGANDPDKPFPTVAELSTVEDLGGWSAVDEDLFDEQSGLVAQLRK
ncbi:MAG: sulfate/thiosulfate transport system substrate-binding protein [Actinomycetota bacterium]|nr:sulfate/thiosulfate transport system substrate-binding protein [Actinomycetota bacterium]